MKYLQIPARPTELWFKIKTVLKYLFIGGHGKMKIKMHLEVIKTLEPFKLQNLIAFRSYFIYMLPYISKALCIEQKHKAAINHYTILREYFSNSQLEQLFTAGIKCYEENYDGDIYAVCLQAVTNHLEFEGSMYLLFKLNNIKLFTLSFTIVPGHVFDYQDSQMICISSVQGAKNEFENIRKATKHFNDNALPVVLLKILQAVALRMGINQFIGISVTNQLSFKDEFIYEHFYALYDGFWINNGGVFLKGNYLMALPLKQKPLHLIAQGHRNRTVRKRKRLDNIYNCASENIKHCIKNRDTQQ